MSKMLKTIAEHLRGLADVLERCPEEIRKESLPESELKVLPENELRSYIGDDNLYREIVLMANSCKKLGNIRSRVRPLLKESDISDDLICSDKMVELLLPHLTNFKGSKAVRNIKSALY